LCIDRAVAVADCRGRGQAQGWAAKSGGGGEFAL
jgi:hypothetical protein